MTLRSIRQPLGTTMIAHGLVAAAALACVGHAVAAPSSPTGTLGCASTTIAALPCSGACVSLPQAIAATEVDGVRHLMWVQSPPSLSFAAATVLPDGTTTVQSIALPAGGGGSKSIAARGDLLVVGRSATLAIYRLVDHQWTLEGVPPGSGNAGERVAIGVGSDGVERIFASATNLATGPLLSSVVRVYRQDPTWAIESTVPIQGSGLFGADIAVSGDTLAIGQPSQSVSSAPATGVRVYTRLGDAWIDQALLTHTSAVPIFFTGFPSAIGHRVALAGDTLITTNAAPTTLNQTFQTGVGGQTNLVVYRRSGGVWKQSDFIGSPSTRSGMGYELVALEDGDDVLLLATVYRKFSPVIDGLLQFRIRNGVVIEETSIPVMSTLMPPLGATTLGVARPSVDATWLAVTVPKELETGIRVIELDPVICAGFAIGDLNGDGVVDGADLGILLSQWGACVGCIADVNGDGVVDGADLGILLFNWSGGR